MNKKKISLVATYNAFNKPLVESLVTNPAAKGLHELIFVNEGNAEDISCTNATTIRITNFSPNREPLVMAVGAHYASGEIIVLCRSPESITESLFNQIHKANKHS